jgi:uncharacterized protein YdeI (YjbR/CyaY-like superfamily)
VPRARYFATLADWRDWLAAHHEAEDFLVVGFHKRATGVPSLTWNESVDGALCFGWIDGVRHNVDARRYTIRFSKRRAGSNWSVKNLARMKQLVAGGLVAPAGLRAYEARRDDRLAVYSFEQRKRPEFSPAQARRFRGNKKAWTWFSAQAPSYQRAVTHWVISAKREATRESRLSTLIADSAAGRRIGPMRPARPSRAKR